MLKHFLTLPSPSFNNITFHVAIHLFFPVHIEDSTEIQHDLSTLVVLPQTRIVVTWNVFSLLPSHAEDPSFYKVNIVLVQFDLNTGEWEDLVMLASGLPNVGQEIVVIPNLVTNNNMVVRPVAIQVRIGEFSGDDVMQRKRPIVRLLVNRVFLWTTILYFVGGGALRLSCEAWCNEQPTDIGERLLDELPPCPPRVTQAKLFNSGFVEDSGLSRLIFHIESDTCFRSREVRWIFSVDFRPRTCIV